MRSGRGQRDEFVTFYSKAYPELVAQVLAITGDARIAKAATDITLARVWRSWPSLRQSPDPLVRARWSAVLVAAEQEPTGAEPAEAVAEITGEIGEDAVVVAALQLLPPVQRRALVLHYMGGVTVNDLAALSGSSAEHIELLLDDGFTSLAETLDWAEEDLADEALEAADDTSDDGTGAEFDDADDPDDLDLRFDWTAEALADTAARLPDEITAPSPAAMLRRAALVRWSTRAVPVAAGAACVAVAIIVAAQPGAPSDPSRPAIYAQNDNGNAIDAPALDPAPDPGRPAGPAAARSADPVRLRSVALTSLLSPTAAPSVSDAAASGSGSGQGSRAVSASSPSSSSSGGGGTAATSSGSTATSGSTSSTTPASTGTTGSTPASSTTATPPSSTTTVPPTTTTTPPVTSTTPPVPPTTTTDPTTTTPPVVPTTTTTLPVTTAPTTTQPVTTDPTITTPPVTTTTLVPHTTITTPTSVIEITTTTTTTTTTTEATTTTADTTTADETTKASDS